jgi:hypothetical protein
MSRALKRSAAGWSRGNVATFIMCADQYQATTLGLVIETARDHLIFGLFPSM